MIGTCRIAELRKWRYAPINRAPYLTGSEIENDNASLVWFVAKVVFYQRTVQCSKTITLCPVNIFGKCRFSGSIPGTRRWALRLSSYAPDGHNASSSYATGIAHGLENKTFKGISMKVTFLTFPVPGHEPPLILRTRQLKVKREKL